LYWTHWAEVSFQILLILLLRFRKARSRECFPIFASEFAKILED
jgi:hypothetical protein